MLRLAFYNLYQQTMPIPLIDSHCHLDRLDLEQVGGSLDHVMNYAKSLGVTHMLCVSITLEDFPTILDISQQYPNVYASVGVHPSETDGREASVAELVTLAQHDKVIAIGETGLDYHYNSGDLEWQRQRFRHHIQAARECQKPLIIHTRDAEEDTIQIMQQQRAHEARGVMHCFTGSQALAQAAMAMDFYISFSGIVTFKNARELQQVAQLIPDERILIETDSPYLTPVPLRGKPNQPAYVKYVAEFLAQLRNVSTEHIMQVTSDNFYRLFRPD